LNTCVSFGGSARTGLVLDNGRASRREMKSRILIMERSVFGWGIKQTPGYIIARFM
jgi:hypothetical protein